MKTPWIAALAALGLSGCSLMIDADSVAPPEEKKPVLGACIDAAGGHALCGGHASGGALPATSAAAHAVERGTVNASAADLSGANHRIKQGTVSP